MKNKLVRKILAVVITGSMVLSMTAYASSSTDGSSAKDVQTTAAAEAKTSDTKTTDTETTDPEKSASGEVKKEETVYVMADATGAKKEIIVENWLKNGTHAGTITDSSNLQDIENVKGEESYTENGQNLVWNAEGNDIYYRGTTSEETPVNEKITYYLNDKEVSPKDLAGKSGQVKIHIDYTNTAKEGEVYVPFTVVTGAVFSNEHVSDVQVDHGKVVTEGKNTVVVGVAFPGLKDSLKLDTANLDAEDVEIPDSVEITMNATDFQMETSLSLVMNDLISDETATDGITDKLDGMNSDLNTLDHSSSQLVEGTQKLKEGTSTLNSKTGDLTGGVQTLTEGANQLKTGSATLASGVSAYVNGAKTVSGGINELHEKTQGLGDSVSALKNGVDTADAGAGTIKEGVDTASGGAGSLAQNMSSVSDGLTSLSAALTGIASSMQEVDNSGVIATLNSLADSLDASASTDTGIAASLSSVVAADQAGTDTVNAAIGSLQNEAVNISNAAADIRTAVTAITSGSTTEAKAQILAVADQISGLQGAASALSGGAAKLQSSLGQLSAGVSSVQNGLGTVSAGLGQLEMASSSLTDGITKLNAGAGGLITEGDKLTNGADTLAEGTNTLYTGTLTLDDGTKQLAAGIVQLADGALELNTGMVKFDEEGIQKLVNAYKEDITPLVDRMEELKKSASSYKTFSGASSDVESSVKFIIKTDGITSE